MDPLKRGLALVGGGQLARMLLQAGQGLGLRVKVLDPDPACPAAGLAHQLVTGGFDDPQALARLARPGDLLTLEIEAPPAARLQALADAGVEVLPSPRVLGLLQDKLSQREFFKAQGLPQPDFAAVEGDAAKAVALFGAPCVLKARRMGYDGRGVLLPAGPQDPALAAWTAPALLERRVDLVQELAVLVVRGRGGQVAAYDPVAMRMDPAKHLLDALTVPAGAPSALLAQARDLAVEAVRALGGVGAFGVELFVDREGRLLLNEVSPRVHNSGHHSIEACATSQFENHWRAVLGLPLGSTVLRSPAATVNVLGPPGLNGPYRVEGLEQARALPGVFVHLYGKAQTRPGRKMGHVTVLAKDPEVALDAAQKAAAGLRFVEAS